jgi:hypothetical protein
LLAGHRTVWAQDKNFGLPLEQVFRLLLGGYTEDVPQLMVHLIVPVGGGLLTFHMQLHKRTELSM